MTAQVLEGTWEEVARQAKDFVGRKVRLLVLEDGDQAKPNQKAIDVLKKVRDKQKDMNFTSGESGVDIVRQGRAGKMFENGTDEHS
jgi:hypothetical protein